jgi:hypothetical protein
MCRNVEARQRAKWRAIFLLSDLESGHHSDAHLAEIGGAQPIGHDEQAPQLQPTIN